MGGEGDDLLLSHFYFVLGINGHMQPVVMAPAMIYCCATSESWRLGIEVPHFPAMIIEIKLPVPDRGPWCVVASFRVLVGHDTPGELLLGTGIWIMGGGVATQQQPRHKSC